MTEEIRAAGGIVVRRRGEQEELLVVHRPRYDDWTFPKGKLKGGESDEQAALREVEEETGLRCRLGRELPRVSYVDHHGRNKSVRYWEMAPLAGTFEPSNEVDEVRWIPVEEASRSLTYARDRDLLENLATTGGEGAA